MDKRFKPITLPEQLTLRQQAVDEVLSKPQRTLAEHIRSIRTTLRLTVPEYASLAKVSQRTLRGIEAGSQGTVQTVESLLGVLGLRLGVQRKHAP